jgi:hypothetical protein
MKTSWTAQTLKAEVASSFETLVIIYQSPRHIPEHMILPLQRCEKTITLFLQIEHENCAISQNISQILMQFGMLGWVNITSHQTIVK